MVARAMEIVIIEDDLDHLALAQAAVERLPWPTVAVSFPYGLEALSYLLHQAQGGTVPDAVVVDLGLPGVDGRSIVRAMQSHDRLRHVPVVVVTGAPSFDSRTQSLPPNVRSVSTKPVTPDALAGLLSAATVTTTATA